MPAHTLVIDLASKPGGTDFRYAEKRSQSIASTWITRYCCPKTAGQILANVLSQLLAADAIAKEEEKK